MVKRGTYRKNEGFQGLLSVIERVCTKLERGKLAIRIVVGSLTQGKCESLPLHPSSVSFKHQQMDNIRGQ